jgi:accessory gene regulator B
MGIDFDSVEIILNSTGERNVIEKMVTDLVSQMEEEKLIDNSIREYYVYALVSWVESFLTVGTIIVISMAVRKFFPTLLFLIFFLTLRQRTGGYHLNRFYQCYLATIISYLLILWVDTGWANHIQILFGGLALSVIFIEIVGTVNHPNMKMNPEELMESKKAARIIGLLEGSIICSCILLGVDRIFISYMAIAVILCAALLCIAKIRKQEVKEDEKN